MSQGNILTDRFDRALLYASHVHGGQVRKGTSTPYVAHLLAVAATVLEYGGDEDLAIAALLHDRVEDQGGKGRLEDVCSRFGERVARIVEACSDNLADTAKGERKRHWQEGQRAYNANPLGFIITAIIAGVIFLTPIALIALWFWALFYFGRLIFRSLRGRSQVDPRARWSRNAAFLEGSGPPEKVFNEFWKPSRGRLG